MSRAMEENLDATELTKAVPKDGSEGVIQIVKDTKVGFVVCI